MKELDFFNLTPLDNEFFAGEYRIIIVPNFTS